MLVLKLELQEQTFADLDAFQICEETSIHPQQFENNWLPGIFRGLSSGGMY